MLQIFQPVGSGLIVGAAKLPVVQSFLSFVVRMKPVASVGWRITRSPAPFPTPLTCSTGTFGDSFADVSCAAANVAAGAALLLMLMLGGRLGCVRGLGLAVLATEGKS
jgi:hypothetical protein